MDQTDVWMLGIGAFGVVFYLFSIYFQRVGGKQNDETDRDA